MLKMKWYECSLPCSLPTACIRLQEHSYSEESPIGFEIVERNPNEVLVKFIEKVEVKDLLVDPFGHEIEVKTVKYVVFDFNLFFNDDSAYLIKINMPPASIKNFSSFLYDIFGFGFYLKPLQFNLVELANCFKENDNIHHFKVEKLKASGMLLGESSSARIEVSSRLDALNDLKAFYSSSHLKIEKMKVSLRLNSNSGKIEVSKTGLFCVDEVLYDDFCDFLFENKKFILN